jgi:ribonuclease HI
MIEIAEKRQRRKACHKSQKLVETWRCVGMCCPNQHGMLGASRYRPDDDKAHQSAKEAWEDEDDKDELNMNLQGLERQFWLGTEAGRLGCYDSPKETWAGDGSAHKGEMGAGSICLHRQDKCLVVRVGREEEGANSLRPELAAVARTL